MKVSLTLQRRGRRVRPRAQGCSPQIGAWLPAPCPRLGAVLSLDIPRNVCHVGGAEGRACFQPSAPGAVGPWSQESPGEAWDSFSGACWLLVFRPHRAAFLKWVTLVPPISQSQPPASQSEREEVGGF